MQATSSVEPRRPISWRRLAWATVLSAIAAAAGTGMLFAAAAAAGIVDTRVLLPTLTGTGPLNLAAVWVATVVAVAGAAVLLALLAVTTRRAVGAFRIVATVVALVSLAMPATVAGPPATMRLTMEGMHAVVWAVCVGMLSTLARREGTG